MSICGRYGAPCKRRDRLHLSHLCPVLPGSARPPGVAEAPGLHRQQRWHVRRRFAVQGCARLRVVAGPARGLAHARVHVVAGPARGLAHARVPVAIDARVYFALAARRGQHPFSETTS